VRDRAVGLQAGLDVLLHRERHVGVAEPYAQRLPVDLGIAARGGVAVADVVRSMSGRPARSHDCLAWRIGTARRLLALAGMTHSPATLARRLHVSRTWLYQLQRGAVMVCSAHAREVAALYEKILNVRGQSGRASRTAVSQGWASPWHGTTCRGCGLRCYP
jgi:hypothetical protein